MAATERQLIWAAGAVAALIGVIVLANRPPDYQVTELTWHTGSADVSGSVTNHTQQGCSQVSVHLTQRDKNDAIVTEDDIAAGSVDAGQTQRWNGALMFIVPKPVGSTTLSMDAAGSCLDRH